VPVPLVAIFHGRDFCTSTKLIEMIWASRVKTLCVFCFRETFGDGTHSDGTPWFSSIRAIAVSKRESVQFPKVFQKERKIHFFYNLNFSFKNLRSINTLSERHRFDVLLTSLTFFQTVPTHTHHTNIYLSKPRQ
jgi:hypothetical protein